MALDRLLRNAHAPHRKVKSVSLGAMFFRCTKHTSEVRASKPQPPRHQPAALDKHFITPPRFF